jgi:hypothetical protein
MYFFQTRREAGIIVQGFSYGRVGCWLCGRRLEKYLCGESVMGKELVGSKSADIPSDSLRCDDRAYFTAFYGDSETELFWGSVVGSRRKSIRPIRRGWELVGRGFQGFDCHCLEICYSVEQLLSGRLRKEMGKTHLSAWSRDVTHRFEVVTLGYGIGSLFFLALDSSDIGTLLL